MDAAVGAGEVADVANDAVEDAATDRLECMYGEPPGWGAILGACSVTGFGGGGGRETLGESGESVPPALLPAKTCLVDEAS
jgi:hypothetical protein